MTPIFTSTAPCFGEDDIDPFFEAAPGGPTMANPFAIESPSRAPGTNAREEARDAV